MTLDLQRCHPYFSAALFENKGDGVDVDCEALRKAIAKKLREATKSDVEREAVEKRTVSTAATIMNTDGVEFGAIHVEETRTPGWYDGTGVKDHLHHLLVVATKGSLMLITATDTGLRDRVVAWTVDAKHGALKDMQAMRRGEIATAFVGTSLKTVWLSATHRRVAVKPDAKVLSGVELEAAFDPLDDQSFSYTSIRTPALGDGQVIGANPSKARLWIGPSRTWDAYTAQVASVLRRVEEVREDAAKGFGGVRRGSRTLRRRVPATGAEGEAGGPAGPDRRGRESQHRQPRPTSPPARHTAARGAGGLLQARSVLRGGRLGRRLRPRP
ncbi:hypothetical protein [Qipengyuania flava]|uniref:hypothetical protein n=1 Tax=Qipengyuania flava TaxID=192812 RepID=UPI001C56DCDB|nr:hypothetical protein [Qipengyuania flava]MBW3169416.1 hypothetical protein [Qipengyuania flava]MBY5966654.1 hypothetical protein [Qipengyuania flava]MBY6012978.1 hypothetical protein [Qipengyuania flava]MBY6027420.1 hypothetical protein [Qipengyuania flava]